MGKEEPKPTLRDQILEFFEGYGSDGEDLMELKRSLLEFEGETWHARGSEGTFAEIEQKVDTLVRTGWLKKEDGRYYTARPRFDYATFEAARKYRYHYQVILTVQQQHSYETKPPSWVAAQLIAFITERLQAWGAKDVGKTRRDPYDCNYIIPGLNLLVSFFTARDDQYSSSFHYTVYALELFTSYSRFFEEKHGFKIRRECLKYLPALSFQYLFECYLHEQLGRGWWINFTQSDFTMHANDFPETLQQSLDLPVEETLVLKMPDPDEWKAKLTPEKLEEMERGADAMKKLGEQKNRISPELWEKEFDC